MLKKKLGALTVAIAMTGALALTGCGGSGAPAAGSAAADAATDEGYTLVSDGKLTIGTSAEYEPFEYMEDCLLYTSHPVLRDLPFILETPHDDLAGYAGEIAYLRGLAG